MEKQNILFTDEKWYNEVQHGDYNISVKKYMSLAEQQVLISDYCSTIIDSSIPTHMRYMQASLALMLGVLDIMTDINIGDGDNYSFSIDGLMASGLYDEITGQINNFDMFLQMLEDSVALTLENHFMNRSLGYKFDSLIGKITATLDNINSMNLDKDSVAELIATVIGIQSEFNDKYQIIAPEQDLAKAMDTIEEEPKTKKRKAK